MSNLSQLDSQFINRISNPLCYIPDRGLRRPTINSGFVIDNPSYPVCHATLFLGRLAKNKTHYIPWATPPNTKEANILTSTHTIHVQEIEQYAQEKEITLNEDFAESAIYGFVRPTNLKYKKFVFNSKISQTIPPNNQEYFVELSRRLPRLTFLVGLTAFNAGNQH
jgi:hypothetical protein